jgi:two-component system cell cycle response regulator DivK
MSAYKILVVEDNPDNLTLIEDILVSLDYEVITAQDGVVGLEKALTAQPDLILMDLSLPKMDGWDVTRKIKADDHIRHIPVIALTAHALLGDRKRALEAGCDDYVSKPIKLPQLVAKLKQYLK